MNFHKTSIADLKIISTDPYVDNRGLFDKVYCNEWLSTLVGPHEIVQVNISKSFSVGCLRGLHFQKTPHAEIKFIRCLKGRVWDVAVDLRKNSSTFLSWEAFELSEKNSNMICIPQGFAHGFQVLEPGSELIYLHTAFYEPTFEGGVHFDDPTLNIAWPLSVKDISERDSKLPFIDEKFEGLE